MTIAPSYRVRLLTICRLRAASSADGVFRMSARRAGELLELNDPYAQRLMRELVKDGALECVKHGSGGVVAEYRIGAA